MNLQTEYMGLTLKNPIVPSSGPLSQSLGSIQRLEDAGAAAVVMYSLFEEQVTSESQHLDFFLNHGSESYAESLSYLPDMESYNVGPDEYLELIRRAKEVAEIPIIGSLNGITTGGWTDYARLIEQAGADALELNIYYVPASIQTSSADVEYRYLDILGEVKSAVGIPVALKLSPFFSATANMAYRLAHAGAHALVLFNRFYQPDFDLDKLEVVPHLVLSRSDEMRLPLRWVAILYGRIPVDFAITTGVHTYTDVLKALMAGAKIAMMTSELLQHGIGRIPEILHEMIGWMEQHEYVSVKQIIGSMSQRNVGDPGAFERANYLKVLASYATMK